MRIFARSGTIVILDNTVALEFIEAYHRKGTATPGGSLISLGFFHKDELLGVAQFCNPRTPEKKRKYSTEVFRIAFIEGVQVLGGVSALISYYRKKFNPADMFTYQDMTGKQSDAYKHAGFTLVKEDKIKKYLVAPGKTLQTAKRKEYYSIGEVSRRGPDALLGTKLGEVFREDGKRKTNPELFIEELGWHTEETKGDRVWEWVNPNMTFYTYKITASDSDKYYYGVSHVKKANATIEDCLNDGYYGSGGVKYKNWKKRHYFNIQKEVIEIFNSRESAFSAELQLIGNKHISDPLCLNSKEGGVELHTLFARETLKENKNCEAHGLTIFVDGVCKKCSVANRTVYLTCEIHGRTKHQGKTCYTCMINAFFNEQICLTHGLTTFSKDTCLKCSHASSRVKDSCPSHGETIFRGGVCLKCLSSKRTILKECSIHGEAPHQGEACYSCIAENRTSNETCMKHGLTKHVGEKCYKCVTEKRFSKRECPIHGLVKFSGNSCATCLASAAVSKRECPVHGIVKFRGAKCAQCLIEKQFTQEECERHSLTKFRSGKCCLCKARKNDRLMKYDMDFTELWEQGLTQLEIGKQLNLEENEVDTLRRKLKISLREIECQSCRKIFTPKTEAKIFCSRGCEKLG